MGENEWVKKRRERDEKFMVNMEGMWMEIQVVLQGELGYMFLELSLLKDGGKVRGRRLGEGRGLGLSEGARTDCMVAHSYAYAGTKIP